MNKKFCSKFLHKIVQVFHNALNMVVVGGGGGGSISRFEQILLVKVHMPHAIDVKF